MEKHYRILMDPLYKFQEDNINIYCNITNTKISDSTIDIDPALRLLYDTMPVIYVRWIELKNRYDINKGIGKSEFEEFCESNSISSIIIAEPGFVKREMEIQDISSPGGQVSMFGTYKQVLYKPYKMNTKDIERYYKQIYFLERLGFKDTEFYSRYDNKLFVYQSKLAEKYLMNIIRVKNYYKYYFKEEQKL